MGPVAFGEPGVPEALACFGWSQRAWAQPWQAWRRSLRGARWSRGLEIGAGPHSSLSPLLLGLTEQVECSYYDPAHAGAIRQLHQRLLDLNERARIRYAQRDVRALSGRWDVIVMKSVLGGVFRVTDSAVADVRILIERLVRDHLNPGGWLVTLDNGVTVLEPLLKHLGARRNGWRCLCHADFPPADAFHRFGVLGSFSAATRLGWIGHRVDDALYAIDSVLTPFARHHAVLLHAYRKPA